MTAEHLTYPSQAAFSTMQPREGSPATLFRQKPDKTFVRKFFNRRLLFPDGAEHEIWSFEDETSGRGLPAPLIRVTESDVVHLTLESSKGPHTIHLHGVEPDPRNDGVGHTSFEVTGSYTYQWSPQPGRPGDPNNGGSAGTYFYHCHVNTVLHVQLGMFGPLIVDPVVHPDYPVTPGLTRRSFVDGPEYDVATETLLAPYSVDPRWHRLSHSAGLSGEDVGLNRFEPRHFYVLGASLADPPAAGGVHALTRVRANVVEPGRAPSLLRLSNANYIPTRVVFTEADGVTPAAIAEVIAHDGRAFRDTSVPGAPSRPLRDMGHRLVTSRLAFGAAERYDVLLFPERAGRYLIRVEWSHWQTEQLVATRLIPLDAS